MKVQNKLFGEKLHWYGLILWNEKEDKEINVCLQADGHILAEREFAKYKLPDGYVCGTVFYIDSQEDDWTKIEEVCELK